MTLSRARILKGAPAGPGPTVPEPFARRVPRAVMDAHAEAEKIIAGAEARAVAAAEAAGDQARAEEIAKLAASALALRQADEQRAERDLDRTIAIATLLAERLVGEALAVAPERIAELAASALQETRGATRIRIEASPEDVTALQAVLGGLAAVTEIVAKDTLLRGSLVVHTDIGQVDGRLRPQIERLAAVLRESMGAKA